MTSFDIFAECKQMHQFVDHHAALHYPYTGGNAMGATGGGDPAIVRCAPLRRSEVHHTLIEREMEKSFRRHII